MSESDRIDELMAAYAMGILDGDDLIEAENYIQQNPEKYRKIIEQNEQAISQTAHAINTQAPSPELKNKLLSDIKQEPNINQQNIRVPFWQRLQPLSLGFALASLVIIFSLIGYIYSLDTKLGSQQLKLAELEALIIEKDSELALLKGEVGEQSEMLAFLENPEVVIINLVKTEPDLKAVGRVLWNPSDDEAMFYALELPEVPEGKTYQLWAIADGEPKNAGVFSIDESGNSVHMIDSLKDIKNVSAFAVSLEPAGGVPAPTGKIYLLGETKL